MKKDLVLVNRLTLLGMSPVSYSALPCTWESSCLWKEHLIFAKVSLDFKIPGATEGRTEGVNFPDVIPSSFRDL